MMMMMMLRFLKSKHVSLNIILIMWHKANLMQPFFILYFIPYLFPLMPENSSDLSIKSELSNNYDN